MSDKIEELSHEFMEKVWENNARSVGLFPIPEYPEFEVRRGMWSTALEVILTTLRYIAPASLLTLFWGHPSFLFKLLKYIDSAVRSLIFSNEEQKQTILQWLGEAGPVRVDKLEIIWRQGWILCGVLDAALPGACAGHPPTKLSLKHAQTIADNYLGVEPVFSRQELESIDTLSRHQEWKLINYLENIRLSISKLTPPALKSNTPILKENSEITHFNLDYVARGSGLVAAQIKNKAYFKIYPTAQQSLDPGEINVLIHGPKNTYGTATLPPILGKAQMIRQNLLGLQSKASHTDNILPITQGTTYFRTYGNNTINKTFYIPKTKYDIDIDFELKQDHARIGYIANLDGKYEISITSSGKNIVGSPFSIMTSNNLIGNLERDSFCLEDGEEIDIVDIKTDRKVVLRIVDFVSEKMLLKENGTFEKISEEEAKNLMETKTVKGSKKNIEDCKLKPKNIRNSQSNRFYQIVRKVVLLQRICKMFHYLIFEKNKFTNSDKLPSEKNKIQDIPYIYNKENMSHNSLEKRNRIIVPENISVSLITEKPKVYMDETILTGASSDSKHGLYGRLGDYNYIKLDKFEDDNLSVDTINSTNNPFINDMFSQGYEVEKGLGSFIANEYETHNSQNEETENLTAKLLIDNEFKNINPFIDSVKVNISKTPGYKIISDEREKETNLVLGNPETEQLSAEGIYSTNPFIKQETDMPNLYQDKPDFIIGAPVSLPPVNLVSSTTSSNTNIEIISRSEISNKINKDTCLTNLQTKYHILETKDPIDDHDFSSLDSNLTQEIIIIPRRSSTSTSVSQSQGSREMSPRKDTWDSAYVSIDDNNCLSENSASDLISEITNKRKSPVTEDFSKIYTPERQILQSDIESKHVTDNDEDNRIYKCDYKRHEFTPIIEENEKNLINDMKGEDAYENKIDIDSVAETFSESIDNYDRLQNVGIEYTLARNDVRVDSASDILADVKRHVKTFGGEISEVQLNATESFSVSQTLHDKFNENYKEPNNNDETQFGDRIYSNIVLEKKKFWDDKIKKIEEQSEEIRLLQNKRRMSPKHLRRNDSFSKKKGKKIVQHILKSNQDDYDLNTKWKQDLVVNVESEKIKDGTTESSNEYVISLIGEPKVESELDKKHPLINPLKATNVDRGQFYVLDSNESKEQKYNSIMQLKQELSEKVFQAFETSPKRFFGTSRTHILNKIDTFSASSDDVIDKKESKSEIHHESGLVSSRISLFHNISQTEDYSNLQRKKSKSLHNISHSANEVHLISNQSDKAPKSEIKDSKKVTNNNITCNISNDMKSSFLSSPLKEKRARLTQNDFNRSFEDTISFSDECDTEGDYVKRTINNFNKQCTSQFQSATNKLKSISKSEMDIFNKAVTKKNDTELDRHKSYEELPKISVKNFISLYEDVSKTSHKASPLKQIKAHKGVSNHQVPSSMQGTISDNFIAVETPDFHSSPPTSELDKPTLKTYKVLPEKCSKISSNQSTSSSLDIDIVSNQDKEASFLSLSDIEIEIIDKDHQINESTPVQETSHLDYKNRFSKAKKFFQSLEELRLEKTVKKFESKVLKQDDESLHDKRPRKKSNVKKSNSMPSSEISKVWNQMQEQQEENKKLVKISEKFNVDDLFEDVMEGRLSRQGSLRGIPHKKAVLETFRSMENIADCKLNSYELAECQLSEFAKDNQIRNAQTYLTEYPYLPTTDPSKYQSRLDVTASGLITFKELKNIPRRNSVPDLRLNPTFTADL